MLTEEEAIARCVEINSLLEEWSSLNKRFSQESFSANLERTRNGCTSAWVKLCGVKNATFYAMAAVSKKSNELFFFVRDNSDPEWFLYLSPIRSQEIHKKGSYSQWRYWAWLDIQNNPDTYSPAEFFTGLPSGLRPATAIPASSGKAKNSWVMKTLDAKYFVPRLLADTNIKPDNAFLVWVKKYIADGGQVGPLVV